MSPVAEAPPPLGSPHIMHTLRRRSSRRRCYRAAKIQLRGGTWARDCLVIDISDVGVRLNAEGLDVPDEFVLLTGIEVGRAPL